MEYRYKITTGKDTTKGIYPIQFNEILNLNPVQEECKYFVTELTGNLQLNISTNLTYCFPGDIVIIILQADDMNRAITYNKGIYNKESFVMNAYSKKVIQFIFDGFEWILN